MTFHKNFFHETIKEIKAGDYNKMIIVGGPHPTTSYKEVLNDKNIDVCVIGEGEATLSEIVKRLMIKKKNNKFLLNFDDLQQIDGIAFSREKFIKKTHELPKVIGR